MASLYIKDEEANALAGRVAAQLGTTKTEAVKRALRSVTLPAPATAVSGSTADWLRTFRAAHPLPDGAAMAADKAFYDSLSDEEDVHDPWAS